MPWKVVAALLDRGELCAVIADMIDSRGLPDRARVQTGFETLVSDLTGVAGPHLVSRFVITTGDECQGLLTSPAPVPAIMEAFRRGLPACRFRFGIGIGSLATPVKPHTLGMDGSVFHNARRAVDAAHQAGTAAAFDSSGRHPDDLLTSYLNLLEDVRDGWTPRQARAAELYRSLGSQTLVAGALDLSQPAVARLLSRARFSLVRDAERAFARFWSERETGT